MGQTRIPGIARAYLSDEGGAVKLGSRLMAAIGAVLLLGYIASLTGGSILGKMDVSDAQTKDVYIKKADDDGEEEDGFQAEGDSSHGTSDGSTAASSAASKASSAASSVSRDASSAASKVDSSDGGRFGLINQAKDKAEEKVVEPVIEIVEPVYEELPGPVQEVVDPVGDIFF